MSRNEANGYKASKTMTFAENNSKHEGISEKEVMIRKSKQYLKERNLTYTNLH